MARILINELASVLSEKKKLNRKDASNFVNELFNLIQEGLEEDRLVKIKGLGTFKIIEVDDRESVNVNTGERVLIEGHNKISFTPDALMKELVNKPFSQFETVVLNDGVDFADTLEESETSDVLETQKTQDSQETTKAHVAEDKQPEPQYVESDVVDEEPSKAPLVDFVETPTAALESEAEEKADETELVDEKAEEIDDHEDIFEDDEDDSGFKWKKWLLPLVFCVVVFAGGYLIGKYAKGQKETTPEKVEKKPIADVDTTATDVKSLVEAPSVAEQKDTLSQEKVAPQAEQITKPVNLDQYEEKDIRVQTGAYRILGTDRLEKVKPNDNLTKICKRTIGPGMECYLEVFNDIKADSILKPGTEIKIPKLELKKKKLQIQE